MFEEKKKNNNNLQETKGNVRVYCRLRPCQRLSERIDYEVTEDMLKIRKDKKELKSANLKMEFDYLFEKVFG